MSEFARSMLSKIEALASTIAQQDESGSVSNTDRREMAGDRSTNVHATHGRR